MFDPSLLLPKRFDQLSPLLDWLAHERSTVYVPKTFYDLSVQGELSLRTYESLHGRGGGRRGDRPPGHELGRGDQPWRAGMPPQAELDDVRRWLTYHEEIVPFAPSPDEWGSLAYQIEVFSEPTDVAQIRREEWVFLQSRSYLMSRIKKPFNTLVRGGAVVIEVGARGLQLLEKRTLRLAADDQAPLSMFQHLRAGAKWIALGGAPALALVQPLLGVVAEASANWFLLLDP
jgi:hypothetical protein